jgi:hypothetical protein
LAITADPQQGPCRANLLGKKSRELLQERSKRAKEAKETKSGEEEAKRAKEGLKEEVKRAKEEAKATLKAEKVARNLAAPDIQKSTGDHLPLQWPQTSPRVLRRTHGG